MLHRQSHVTHCSLTPLVITTNCYQTFCNTCLCIKCKYIANLCWWIIFIFLYLIQNILWTIIYFCNDSPLIVQTTTIMLPFKKNFESIIISFPLKNIESIRTDCFITILAGITIIITAIFTTIVTWLCWIAIFNRTLHYFTNQRM